MSTERTADVLAKLNGPAAGEANADDEWFESRVRALGPGVRPGIQFLFDIAEKRGFSDLMDFTKALHEKTDLTAAPWFTRLLPATEPPERWEETTSELYRHAEASLGLECMRRVAHDTMWPEMFERLKQPGKDRKALLLDLSRIIASAKELPSLNAERDSLRDNIASCDNIRDKVTSLLGGARTPIVRGALMIAQAALSSASASLNAELARVDGFTAMTPKRGRGVKHSDNELVKAVDDVLAFHEIRPKESAEFIRKQLPEYWEWKLASSSGHGDALTKLADTISAKRRSPKK